MITVNRIIIMITAQKMLSRSRTFDNEESWRWRKFKMHKCTKWIILTVWPHLTASSKSSKSLAKKRRSIIKRKTLNGLCVRLNIIIIFNYLGISLQISDASIWIGIEHWNQWTQNIKMQFNRKTMIIEIRQSKSTWFRAAQKFQDSLKMKMHRSASYLVFSMRVCMGWIAHGSQHCCFISFYKDRHPINVTIYYRQTDATFDLFHVGLLFDHLNIFFFLCFFLRGIFFPHVKCKCLPVATCRLSHNKICGGMDFYTQKLLYRTLNANTHSQQFKCIATEQNWS